MLRLLGISCVAAALASAWLSIGDRHTPLALTVVEWDQRIGVPVYVALAFLGITLLLLASRGVQASPVARPARQQPSTPSKRKLGGDGSTFAFGDDWFDDIRKSAKKLEFESGARLTLNIHQACAVVLTLEQMPPERARRAVATLGAWLASIPLPPRAKVVFDHCPEGGSPRHHQVAGAIASSISRSQFRVVSHLDAVEVMFHHPGVMWPSIRMGSTDPG